MPKKMKMSVKLSDGLPVEFRIFAPGVLTYTLPNTQTVETEITAEDITQMSDWHAQKNVRLPIDCEHYLHYVSTALGYSEKDVKDRLPNARGVLGDCVITERDGELWATDVKFNDLAKPFIQRAFLRYFSPVIYGLGGKGPKKLTSIAFTANPAINNSEPLVASDSDEGVRLDPIVMSDVSDDNINPKMKGESPMNKKFLEFLKQTFGIDAPAVMSDAEADTAIASIQSKMDAKTTEDSEAVTALSDANKRIESLENEVRALNDTASKSELEAIIERGKNEGKITAAQEEWARKQSAAVLSDFLTTAPVVVHGRINPPASDKTPAVLTDSEKEMAEACGLTHEEFSTMKKGNSL